MYNPNPNPNMGYGVLWVVLAVGSIIAILSIPATILYVVI